MKSEIAWIIATVIAVLIIAGLATGTLQSYVRDLSDFATEQTTPEPKNE